MADYPALPLWTDAYMLDCGHLSDAEHGRYLLLLILIWHSPECRVPNEPEWIARKLNRSVERFNAEIAPLIAEFCYSTGNWLEQKRLKKEWNYLKRQSKKQSDNANARWHNEKDDANGHAKRMPTRSQTHAPTPTPTPITPLPPQGGNGRSVLEGKEGKPMAGKIPLDENSEQFKAWEAHKKATTGRGWPRTTIRLEGGKPFTGWYFPSEWPPTVTTGAAPRSVEA